MKFIEFEDKNYGTKLINPVAVSSIQPGSPGTVLIIEVGGGITTLDYQGVNTSKAMWYVTETLKLGYHPYADSIINYRDNNWERNAPEALKNEEIYGKGI
jgi:hypothetical protein